VSRLGVSCGCGYSLKSCINAEPNGPLTGDPNAYLKAIKNVSGMDAGQFDAVVAWARAEVEKHYGADEFDKIFKGKWYACILHADVIKHLQGKPANRNALEVRLTPAIAQ